MPFSNIVRPLSPSVCWGYGVSERGRGRVMTQPHAPRGVLFPTDPGNAGKRSTSRLGRTVVADALRGVDPVGARAAEQETNWRRDYLLHFRRLVEAGLLSAAAASTIASDGLTSLHDAMRYVDAAGNEGP